MEMDRRGFLRVAGLGALGAGLAGGRLLAPGEALASEEAGAARGGVRWAMVVDLRKECPDGCAVCTKACHEKHNVPTLAERRHEVKWIWKTQWKNAFVEPAQQVEPPGHQERPVMVLCNHCENPPCVRVCPTKATFKRPDGIVAMDFHRCIGCRFCMAGCPYGSRSFNWVDPRTGLPGGKATNPDFPTRMRGVVEKCNFCTELLGKQLPWCVQACPEGILTFGDINRQDSAVRGLLTEHHTIRRKAHLGTDPQVYYIV